MLGTPHMVLLGDRTKHGEIEVENSKTGNKCIISQAELVKKLGEFGRAKLVILLC